jgi:hypothetical protein
VTGLVSTASNLAALSRVDTITACTPFGVVERRKSSPRAFPPNRFNATEHWDQMVLARATSAAASRVEPGKLNAKISAGFLPGDVLPGVGPPVVVPIP